MIKSFSISAKERSNLFGELNQSLHKGISPLKNAGLGVLNFLYFTGATYQCYLIKRLRRLGSISRMS
jgi:hypothetical protein